MKYIIRPEVFKALPDLCCGAVAATDLSILAAEDKIEAFLAEEIARCEEHFAGVNIKAAPEILPYREAFERLGINPNKYPPSLESLVSRIAKGKGFPRINPLVDLGNAISLKYFLPVGAHDMDSLENALEVRVARADDIFLPFGSTEEDNPISGEIVYASGNKVRTRRFLWRQSDIGKVDIGTANIFFPIDGFSDRRKDIEAACEEIARDLRNWFEATVITGIVEVDYPEFLFTPDADYGKYSLK